MSVGLAEKPFSVVPGRLPVGGTTGNRPVGMMCWELSLGVAGVGGGKKLPIGEVPSQRPDRTPPVAPRQRPLLEMPNVVPHGGGNLLGLKQGSGRWVWC